MNYYEISIEPSLWVRKTTFKIKLVITISVLDSCTTFKILSTTVMHFSELDTIVDDIHQWLRSDGFYSSSKLISILKSLGILSSV